MVQCLNCRHFSLRDPRIELGGEKLERTARTMHQCGAGNCARYPIETFVSPTWERTCGMFEPVPEADMPVRVRWLESVS